MSSENVIGSDTERLQILLKIAREQNLSFDDLDDWTYHLDWEEFQDWSKIFLKTQLDKICDFRPRPRSGTMQPHREFANDNTSVESDRSEGD